MTDTTQKPLVRLAERIEGIADELRVRAHLAGAEAKTAWDHAHVERIADELKIVRDEAKVQGHLASLDAKDALSRIEKRAEELRNKTGISVDHLARDLSDALTRLARALRGEKSTGASAKG